MIQEDVKMRTHTYSTTDFYLSAYLKALGFQLMDTEKDGRRTTFVFKDQENRKEMVRSFYNEGVVNINAFKNAIQDLKAVVYNL